MERVNVEFRDFMLVVGGNAGVIRQRKPVFRNLLPAFVLGLYLRFALGLESTFPLEAFLRRLVTLFGLVCFLAAFLGVILQFAQPQGIAHFGVVS